MTGKAGKAGTTGKAGKIEKAGKAGKPRKTSLPPNNKTSNTPITMTRAIITVVGKDTVGIIARVCTYLADNQINILDISQTIVQEFFNMMMIVDLTKSVKAFSDISDELAKIGEDTGVQVKCQLEDIFDKMHRI